MHFETIETDTVLAARKMAQDILRYHGRDAALLAAHVMKSEMTREVVRLCPGEPKTD